MKRRSKTPDWLPFALLASGLVAVAAGVKSGWKTSGGTKPPSSSPPPINQASFP